MADRVISNFRFKLYSDRNSATVPWLGCVNGRVCAPPLTSGGSGCQLIHIQLGTRNGVYRCRTTLDDQRLSGFPGSILSLPLTPLGTIVQAGEHTRPLYERMSYTFSASDFVLRLLPRDRPLVAGEWKHPRMSLVIMFDTPNPVHLLPQNGCVLCIQRYSRTLYSTANLTLWLSPRRTSVTCPPKDEFLLV